MSIQIPPELQWVAYLAGSEWPKGDEDAMWHLGEIWHGASAKVEALIPDLARVQAETLATFYGQTADAARSDFQQEFSGDYSMDNLVSAMSALGDSARQTGTEIQYTKLNIIVTLAVAAAEIAYYMYMAALTFGADLGLVALVEAITEGAIREFAEALIRRIETAVAEALTKTGLWKLAKSLGLKALGGAAVGGGLGFVQEFAIEEGQVLAGHRDSLDWNQIGLSLAGGAVGGVGGAWAHGAVAGALGEAKTVITKALHGAVTHYTSGVVGNVAGSLPTGGGLNAKEIFGGAAGNAFPGIAGDALSKHGTGDPTPPPDIDLKADKDGPPKLPLPDPEADEPPPSFQADVSPPPYDGGEAPISDAVNTSPPPDDNFPPPDVGSPPPDVDSSRPDSVNGSPPPYTENGSPPPDAVNGSPPPSTANGSVPAHMEAHVGNGRAAVDDTGAAPAPAGTRNDESSNTVSSPGGATPTSNPDVLSGNGQGSAGAGQHADTPHANGSSTGSHDSVSAGGSHGTHAGQGDGTRSGAGNQSRINDGAASSRTVQGSADAPARGANGNQPSAATGATAQPRGGAGTQPTAGASAVGKGSPTTAKSTATRHANDGVAQGVQDSPDRPQTDSAHSPHGAAVTPDSGNPQPHPDAALTDDRLAVPPRSNQDTSTVDESSTAPPRQNSDTIETPQASARADDESQHLSESHGETTDSTEAPDANRPAETDRDEDAAERNGEMVPRDASEQTTPTVLETPAAADEPSPNSFHDASAGALHTPEDLAVVVERIAGPLRVVPSGDDPRDDAAACTVLLGEAIQHLYPDRLAPLPATRHTLDDSVLDGRPVSKLIGGAEAAPVTSWKELDRRLDLAAARTGSATALVLVQHANAMGHAVGAHRFADGKVAYFDLHAAPGERVSVGNPPNLSLTRASAVILDGAGNEVPQPRPESSTADALIDPVGDPRYGRGGLEGEYHGGYLVFPVHMEDPHTANPADRLTHIEEQVPWVARNERHGLKIVMDLAIFGVDENGTVSMRRSAHDDFDEVAVLPVLEFVTERPLPELRNDPRTNTVEALAVKARALNTIDRTTRPTSADAYEGSDYSLADLLSEEDGWTLHPNANEFRFAPAMTGGSPTMLMHDTKGVPVAAISDFMRGIDKHIWDPEHRELHGDGQRFAASVVEKFRAAGPEGTPSAAERRELRGAMWLAYTQVAGLAMTTVNLHNIGGKAFSAVAMRQSLGTLHDELSPRVKAFLNDNAGEVRALFERQFLTRMPDFNSRYVATRNRAFERHQASPTYHTAPTRLPEGGNVGPLDAVRYAPRWESHGRSTLSVGDYLDTVLLNEPRVRVNQDQAFGVRTHFDDLDRERPGEPGLLLLELRSVGERRIHPDQIPTHYAQSRDITRRAVSAVEPTPASKLAAPRTRIVTQPWGLGSSRFGHSGSASGPQLPHGHSPESLANRYPWLTEVNPDRESAEGQTNCVMTAIAFVIAEREQDIFQAPPTERLPGVDLLNFHRQSLGLGDDDHQVSVIPSFGSAADALASAGRGAMALIAVRGDHDTVNHVYVAVVDDHGVTFLDPQRGELATDPVDATALAMLPLTEGIPAPQGSRPLTVEEASPSSHQNHPPLGHGPTEHDSTGPRDPESIGSGGPEPDDQIRRPAQSDQADTDRRLRRVRPRRSATESSDTDYGENPVSWFGLDPLHDPSLNPDGMPATPDAAGHHVPDSASKPPDDEHAHSDGPSGAGKGKQPEGVPKDRPEAQEGENAASEPDRPALTTPQEAPGSVDRPTHSGTVHNPQLTTHTVDPGRGVVTFDERGEPVIPTRTLPGTSSTTPPAFTADRPSSQLNPAVDTASITGVTPSPENPNADIYFRTDSNFVFRDDTRSPERIFRRGFAPRRVANTNLWSMLSDQPSAFVSTTRDPNFNHMGTSTAHVRVYRYLIYAPGGIDINATFGSSHGGDHEEEVAFPGGIRRENIVGAHEVLGGPTPIQRVLGTATDLVLGDFRLNANFDPSAANPHFPVQASEARSSGHHARPGGHDGSVPSGAAQHHPSGTGEQSALGGPPPRASHDQPPGTGESRGPDESAPREQSGSPTHHDEPASPTGNAPRTRIVTQPWGLGSSRFGHSGSASGPQLPHGHSPESLANRYPWLTEVNPDRESAEGQTNCVMTAIAFVIAEREQDIFQAPPTERLPGVDLLNFHRQSLGLGDDDHQVSVIPSFGSAADALASAGRGAMALIAVRGDHDTVNHVYVAVVDDHGVTFLDPQRGELATDPVDATALAMLPLTEGIPAPQGSRPLTVEEASPSSHQNHPPLGHGPTEHDSVGPRDPESILAQLESRTQEAGPLPSAQLDPTLDPRDITGLPDGATVQIRTDLDVLYRDDTRSPEEIFRTGFEPLDPTNTNLTSFGLGRPAAFVSTTREPELNHLGPPTEARPNVFRYRIYAPGGIDINATLPLHQDVHEREIVFLGGIRRENILGAEQVVGTGPGGLRRGPYVHNEGFNRDAPNPHFPNAAEPQSPDSPDLSDDEVTPTNTPRARPGQLAPTPEDTSGDSTPTNSTVPQDTGTILHGAAAVLVDSGIHRDPRDAPDAPPPERPGNESEHPAVTSSAGPNRNVAAPWPFADSLFGSGTAEDRAAQHRRNESDQEGQQDAPTHETGVPPHPGPVDDSLVHPPEEPTRAASDHGAQSHSADPAPEAHAPVEPSEPRHPLPLLPDDQHAGWQRVLEDQGGAPSSVAKGKRPANAPVNRLEAWDRYVAAFNAHLDPSPSTARELRTAHDDLVWFGLDPDAVMAVYRAHVESAPHHPEIADRPVDPPPPARVRDVKRVANDPVAVSQLPSLASGGHTFVDRSAPQRDSDARIRRAVDAVLPGRDVEQGTRPVGAGEAADSAVRARPRGLDLGGRAVALGKATTLYKDVSQHDDAKFMQLLREQLTDPETGKTVLASLIDELDELKFLVETHPRRALSESQQTAYQVLRNSAGSTIDNALGSARALSRDESWLNRLVHHSLTPALLAAPYAVPVLDDPRAYNFIALAAASETRAVLRMGGMARHAGYSGRLLRSALMDLVVPWSVPGLTYLLPAVVPSLHQEQTDLRWAIGSALFQSALFFGAGFPNLFPDLFDRVVSLGQNMGLPLPVTQRRALANGELRLLKDTDAPPAVEPGALESQPQYLTQESLMRAITQVRSRLDTIQTAQRMFEDRGGQVSDNTDRQIGLIRHDISHLEHLGAQLIDTHEGEAGPVTPRANVDFPAKLGYVGATGVVRGIAAAASLTNPLSASDVLPATAFLMTRSIMELRDPNVTQRDAANTFNNFTPPGLVAIVPNVVNLATNGRVFENVGPAAPWIAYSIAANATWGNWVGGRLSHGVSGLIDASQRHWPTVRDTVQSWLGGSAAPRERQDPGGDHESSSAVGETEEALGVSGMPGGFTPDAVHPSDSQADVVTPARDVAAPAHVSVEPDPVSPSGSAVRADPAGTPEDAAQPSANTDARAVVDASRRDHHTDSGGAPDAPGRHTRALEEDTRPATGRVGEIISTTTQVGSIGDIVTTHPDSHASEPPAIEPHGGPLSSVGRDALGSRTGVPDQQSPRSRSVNWLALGRRDEVTSPSDEVTSPSASPDRSEDGDTVTGRRLPGAAPEQVVDGHTRQVARIAVLRRLPRLDPADKALTGLVDPDAMRHTSDDARRATATARANARWWRGLDEEQRRAVIATYPDQVGNAEGLPPRVRDEANRRMLKEVLAREESNPRRLIKPIERLYDVESALRRAELRARRIGGEPPLVLAFDPEAFRRDGRIVVSVGGDPYRAPSVSWIVPGMTTTISSLDSVLHDAVNLTESARDQGAAGAVTIAWIGYDAPSGWRSGRVTTRAAAAEGGDRLHADIRAFNAGRDATADDGTHFSNNHVFGHSYGSTTTGYAGRDGRLASEVQTVTLLGSPGAGPIRHADEFGIGHNVFVAGSSRDPVTALGRTPATDAWVGQGIDPTLRDFGARRLASEFPRSMDTVANAATHVSYYRPIDDMGRNSQSLTNFGRIVAGQLDQLHEHPHRVDGRRLVGIQRTAEPARDPSAARRWWGVPWDDELPRSSTEPEVSQTAPPHSAAAAEHPQTPPVGSDDVSDVATVDHSGAPAPAPHTSAGPAPVARPTTTPQLRFGEQAKKLDGTDIGILHRFASDIVTQAVERYESDANASGLVVHVEAGGNGRRWPLSGWPLSDRAQTVGQIRAKFARIALEAEVRDLLDQHNVPQSTVMFRHTSRGRGLPENNGKPHDFDSDETARRVVVIRIEEAAPVSKRLDVSFAERAKKFGDTQKDEIEPFIAHVVNEAARRHAAGEGGLVVDLQGGGNSERRWRGADTVGLKRARNTREFLAEEVTRRLRDRGIDTDMVTFSEPASRGRSLPGDTAVTGDSRADAAARRIVVVGLDDADPSSTTHGADQHILGADPHPSAGAESSAAGHTDTGETDAPRQPASAGESSSDAVPEEIWLGALAAQWAESGAEPFDTADGPSAGAALGRPVVAQSTPDVHGVAQPWSLGGSRFGDAEVAPMGPELPHGHSPESLATRYPWLTEVNPGRESAEGQTNCVMTAIAFVISEREQETFQAPPTERLPGVDLLNFHRHSLELDADQHQVSLVPDFRSAADALASAGRGAMAMIAVRGAHGDINHVYVAVVDDHGVTFLDPQRGKLATDPVDATALAMVPLTQGIPAPRGSRLLTAEEVAPSSHQERPPQSVPVAGKPASEHETVQTSWQFARSQFGGLPTSPTPTVEDPEPHPAVGAGVEARPLPVLPSGERASWRQELEHQGGAPSETAKGKLRDEAPIDRLDAWDRHVSAFNARHHGTAAPEHSTGVSTERQLEAAHNDLVALGLDPDAVMAAYRARFEQPEAESPTDVHQPKADAAPPESSEERAPGPKVPVRIGDRLVLGGIDVLEEFRSDDQGLAHVKQLVIDHGGEKVWKQNEAQVTALFSDDGIRPKVPGMLRAGQTIKHTIHLGFGRALEVEFAVHGGSDKSYLGDGEDTKYEFEHTSDNTNTAGSANQKRFVRFLAVQGNLQRPEASDTAALILSRAHDSGQTIVRADRQVSGGQTAEAATRFKGQIASTITHRFSGSSKQHHVNEILYRTKVVVPTRDVLDDVDDYGLTERQKLSPEEAALSAPPRIAYTHALSGSDVVTNLWLLRDERGNSPNGEPKARGPRPRTIHELVTERPADTSAKQEKPSMPAAFEKALGKRQAKRALAEAEKWLTIEKLESNLHGMTNKQPLVLDFKSVPGAWLEVHAFIEPLGTPAAPGHSNHGGTDEQMMRGTSDIKEIELHYGNEADTSRTRQDAITHSLQWPLLGRARGQGGPDAAEVEGGLDGTVTQGQVNTETDSRQFRIRNTLKNPAAGQAWHGQVRLRFEVHTADAAHPAAEGKPTGAAAYETNARFDVTTEKSETTPPASFKDTEVWAPPLGIWGDGPPAERNSWIGKSRWWRLSGGSDDARGRPAEHTDNAGADRAPEDAPDREPPRRGLGSMDRITNLDLSGFRGMVDVMGHRAFGNEWKGVRSGVLRRTHLNRIRGALGPMTQHSPLTLTELNGRGSTTKVSFTADFEKLTYKRVVGKMMSSPSMEITEGSADTTDTNRQIAAQGAVGGRGGDVNDSTVLGELIVGANQSVRDGDRQRDQQRVAVATKFEQPMAIFEGWIRIDGTMDGPKGTSHESGLFAVEIAIPLTELQGARTHDDDMPPTFTRDVPTGFIDDLGRTSDPESGDPPVHPVKPEAEAPPPAPVAAPPPTPVAAPKPTRPDTMAKLLMKRLRPIVTSPAGSRPSSPGPSRLASPITDPHEDPDAIELSRSPSVASSLRDGSPTSEFFPSRERFDSPTPGPSPGGSRASSPAPGEAIITRPSTMDSAAPLLAGRRETADSATSDPGSASTNPFVDPRPARQEEPLARRVFRRPANLRINPAGLSGIRPASPGRSRAISYNVDPHGTALDAAVELSPTSSVASSPQFADSPVSQLSPRHVRFDPNAGVSPRDSRPASPLRRSPSRQLTDESIDATTPFVPDRARDFQPGRQDTLGSLGSREDIAGPSALRHSSTDSHAPLVPRHQGTEDSVKSLPPEREEAVPPVPPSQPKAADWQWKQRDWGSAEAPAHASSSAWHPADMLIGIDPPSGLLEAIRHDLAPALGTSLDHAMTGVSDEFGPRVLAARLIHQSGQQWSHDIAVPGGKITVKVRPERLADAKYLGSTAKFETDLSIESQSSATHTHGAALRPVIGGRVQIPVPHGSVSVQATHSKSIRPKDDIEEHGITGLSGVNTPTLGGDIEHRVPARTRATEAHNLFRQPIRFHLSYEQHVLPGMGLTGIPTAPKPVRLHGVFSYPKDTISPPSPPTPEERARSLRLRPNQTVMTIRPFGDPNPARDAGAPEGEQRASASSPPSATPNDAPPKAPDPRTPDEDLVATHILNSMAAEGRSVFGAKWPQVRAELAQHVRTIRIQGALGDFSRRGFTIIDLSSVPGGQVVLFAHVHTMEARDSKAATEFYTGGPQSMTSTVSESETSSTQAYVQGQADAVPLIPWANFSLIGRLFGSVGTENTQTRTDNSATGTLFRKKVATLTHAGVATIETRMLAPADETRLGHSDFGVGRAQVAYVTRESPTDEQQHQTLVARAGIIPQDSAVPGPSSDPGLPARGLSHDSIVRKIVDGDNFRHQVLKRLAALKITKVDDVVGHSLNDFRVASRLPAMTRVGTDDDEVELVRYGNVRITGRADVQSLDFKEIEHQGGNAYILNDVNQNRLNQHSKNTELGFRLLIGPRFKLPFSFSGYLLGGGGFSGRHRVDSISGDGARLSANAKVSRSNAVFDAATRITLTAHQGKARHPLGHIDVHGPILIPESETLPVDTTRDAVDESSGNVDPAPDSAARPPSDPPVAPPAEPGPSHTNAGGDGNETSTLPTGDSPSKVAESGPSTVPHVSLSATSVETTPTTAGMPVTHTSHDSAAHDNAPTSASTAANDEDDRKGNDTTAEIAHVAQRSFVSAEPSNAGPTTPLAGSPVAHIARDAAPLSPTRIRHDSPLGSDHAPGSDREALTRGVDAVVAQVERQQRDVPAGGPVNCVVLLEGLRELFHPEGVHTARAVDESAIVDHGTVERLMNEDNWSRAAEARIAPGAEWADLSDWSAAESAARRAGPGSTVYVLMSRLSGEGHAFALRHTQDGQLFWIDPHKATGQRLLAAGDRPVSPSEWARRRGDELEAPVSARVLVVDSHGAGRPELVAQQPASASTARVITDAPTDHRYGKGGFEKEKPRYRIRELPDDFGAADRLVTGRIDVGLDKSPEGDWILETISAPGAMVPGEEENGAPTVEQLLDHQREMDALLRNKTRILNSNVKIGAIFSDRSKYTIEPGAEDIEVFADLNVSEDKDAVQYTGGIDADYDWAFLHRLSGLAWHKPANTYLLEGLEFGRETARRFLNSPQSGYRGDAGLGFLVEAMHSDPNVTWIRTIATSAYLHNSAVLRFIGDVIDGKAGTVGPKNYTPAVSRVTPSALVADAPQAVKDFLAHNRDQIRESFVDSFQRNEPRPHNPELPDIRDWPLPDQDQGGALQGPPWTKYFDNYLLPDPEEVVDQYAAMGVRTRFDELDNDNGTRRGQAFDVWELRFLDGLQVKPSVFEDRFHWLRDTSQSVHSQADESRHHDPAVKWREIQKVSSFPDVNATRQRFVSALDDIWKQDLAGDSPPRNGLLASERGQRIRQLINGLDRSSPATWNRVTEDLTLLHQRLRGFQQDNLTSNPIKSSRELLHRQLEQAIADLKQIVGELKADSPPWLHIPPNVDHERLATFADQVVRVATRQQGPVQVHLDGGARLTPGPFADTRAHSTGLRRARSISDALLPLITERLRRAGIPLSRVTVITGSRGANSLTTQGYRVADDDSRRAVVGWVTVSGAAPAPPSRPQLELPLPASSGDDGFGLSTYLQ